MPHTCLSCRSPERLSVDLALLSGEPVREVGGRFGLDKSSVWRHREAGHVSEIARAEYASQELFRASAIAAHLASLLEKVSRVIDRLEDAETASEIKVLLGAVRESKDLLALALKYAPTESKPTLVVQQQQGIDLDSDEMSRLRDEVNRYLLDVQTAMIQVVTDLLSTVPEEVRQGFGHIGWHMSQAARSVEWRTPELQKWWTTD
jgi:hypothetical protein